MHIAVHSRHYREPWKDVSPVKGLPFNQNTLNLYQTRELHLPHDLLSATLEPSSTHVLCRASQAFLYSFHTGSCF